MPDNKALIQEVKAFIRDQDRMLNEKPDRMATDDEKEEVAEYLASVMPDIKAYQDKLKLADDLSRGMFDTIQSYLGSFFITEDWSDVDVLADDELESLSVQLLGLQQRITDTFSNKEDVKLQEEEVEEIQEVVEPEKPNPELEASKAENARLRAQLQEQQAEIARLRTQLQASQKSPSPPTITEGIDSGSDSDNSSREETREQRLQRILRKSGVSEGAMSRNPFAAGFGGVKLKKAEEDPVDKAIKDAKDNGKDLVDAALEAAQKAGSKQAVAVGKAAKAAELNKIETVRKVIDFLEEIDPDVSEKKLMKEVVEVAKEIGFDPMISQVMVKQASMQRRKERGEYQEVTGPRTHASDSDQEPEEKSEIQRRLEQRRMRTEVQDIRRGVEESKGNDEGLDEGLDSSPKLPSS